MGTRNHSDVPIVFWSLLALLIHMLNCLGANGFSIKLIPRYSIDSSLFPQNLSLLEKNYRIAELSKARALCFKFMNFANSINSTKQGIQTLQPKDTVCFEQSLNSSNVHWHKTILCIIVNGYWFWWYMASGPVPRFGLPKSVSILVAYLLLNI